MKSIYCPTVAAISLSNVLNKLFSREVVIATLGMSPDIELSDEQWLDHARTVKTRFYSYCLVSADLPLITEQDKLTQAEYGLVMFVANNLLREGLTYAKLYRWWRLEGQFRHTQAYHAKRQAAALAERRMRVMVFIEGSKPKYLSSNDLDYILVDKPEDALAFPVLVSDELSQSLRDDYAVQFDFVLKAFGATRVKVLVGNAA